MLTFNIVLLALLALLVAYSSVDKQNMLEIEVSKDEKRNAFEWGFSERDDSGEANFVFARLQGICHGLFE